MARGNIKPDDSSSLSPFPEGWYFVSSREAILKAKLIRKTWMGEEIVAWCDGDGRVCVAEAVCPHLGSELGPDAGGRVRDGCLVCPFHGYEFDVSGQCVATPFAPPPRAAKLKVFEIRDVLGMVFAWWGINGRPPQWSLPENPPSGADWSELRFQTFRFPGHPQETTENAVDVAHLRYVHGYDNVSRIGRVRVDGACLEGHFDFKRVQTIAGIMDLVFEVSAFTRVVGLGYSFVEVHERSIPMDMRLWVLATPIDGNVIEVVHAAQVRAIRKPNRPIMGLRFVPLADARQDPEPVHDVGAEVGLSAGCEDLAAEAVPVPPATVPVRRGDRDLSTVLQTVLRGPPGFLARCRNRPAAKA